MVYFQSRRSVDTLCGAEKLIDLPYLKCDIPLKVTKEYHISQLALIKTDIDAKNG
ncbi:protein of unknown function [Shewanella benthica]|uniref:Uncharacterized protein n=1 Tax=Shewanella benthica TaxID=43661 RepID=A0A330M5U3_9GAMM|nr:protein of unknown function [Shewanella benthica]